MTLPKQFESAAPIRDTHETPPALFAKYNAVWRFTLDVCALPETAKCARYFTPVEDGLLQDWGANVCWMNPPYGRKITRWLVKARDAASKGATVVCLVPSRTGTRWWHDHVMRGEIEFIKGRIKFVGSKTGAKFDSAIVVFRPNA